MTAITQQVWQILSEEYAIKKGLYDKIINHRALARHIKDKYRIGAPTDAIISAIRRFELTDELQYEFEYMPQLLKNADISAKNNLALVRLKNDINFYATFREFIRKIEGFNRQKFRCVISQSVIKFVSDINDLKAIEELFRERIISTKKKLAEINVIMNPEMEGKKGVAAAIIGEISQQGIGIVEVIICAPDFLIYVGEKDFTKVYEALINLCSPK